MYHINIHGWSDNTIKKMIIRQHCGFRLFTNMIHKRRQHHINQGATEL